MKLWLCAGTLAVPCLFAALPRALDAAIAAPEEFEGRLEASRVTLVACARDGLLETVHVDVGDVVEAGQVLARLDARTETLALELAEIRLRAHSESERARAIIADADARIARRAALYDQGLLAGTEREAILHERHLAEVDLLAAAEQRELDQLARRSAELALEQARVRAPSAGVVVERLLSPGEYVGRSQPAIVRLAALDPLHAEVALPARLLGTLRRDDRAWIRPERAPGDASPDELEARVVAVEREVETASATFVVRLALENKALALPAGLRCKVRFDR